MNDPHHRRIEMVDTQLRARGIDDPRVLAAMRTVPRHEFVPESLTDVAYADRALPLGPQQTISQPYMVGLMTSLAADFDNPASGRDRALEIGTGSGYQAAVLAELFAEVWTVELDKALAARAHERLDALAYRNVHVRAADGREGWPDAAPFDAVLLTASTDRAPAALLQQLRIGGRLVYPLRSNDDARGDEQMLRIARRLDAARFDDTAVCSVRFVPLR